MSMNQSGEQQQQQQQEQQPPTETVTSAAQTNATHPYQIATTTASGTPQIVVPAQQQLAFQQAQQFHHQQQQHQQQQLQSFWANQTKDIEQTTDFKNHSLPLARIKKIMKADEDVRMISAEAPVVFAKACEMFILELTLMSWIHTEENKRRTLQKNDIAAAITRTDIFDFLVDIVPRDDLNESFGFPRTAIPLPAIGTPADAIPYYYMHPHHPTQVAVPPGAIYPQSQPPIPYMPWLQPQPPQQTDQQLQQPQTDVAEQ